MSVYAERMRETACDAFRAIAEACRDGCAGVLDERVLREEIEARCAALADAAGVTWRELYPPEPVPEGGVGIDAESSTEDVLAWLEGFGLDGGAKVVGSWVWILGAPGIIPERLEAIVRAAGFVYSERRRGWFHRCGVESKGTAPGKPLSRLHETSSPATYRAGKHDDRPAWVRRKAERAAGRKRRAAVRRGERPQAWAQAVGGGA